MASALQSPGLPELTDDLGANFAAVAALFASPVETAVTLVISKPPTRVDSIVELPSQPSPSDTLPQFWRDNANLHSFIMVSFAAFTETQKNAPTFPVESLDSSYKRGWYLLRPGDLQTVVDGKWKLVHAFPSKGVPLTAHTATSKSRYFLLH